MTEAREQNGRSLWEQSSGTRVDWVTSAKPRSSLCCLPHQKRTSTSTSTTEKNHVIVIGLLFFLKNQDFPGIETYRESPELLSLSPALFLKRRFSEGGAAAADRRVFARIQITLPCQSRFLDRNSRTALFAAQGPPRTQRPLFVYITLQKQPRCRAYSSGRSPRLSPSFK